MRRRLAGGRQFTPSRHHLKIYLGHVMVFMCVVLWFIRLHLEFCCKILVQTLESTLQLKLFVMFSLGSSVINFTLCVTMSMDTYLYQRYRTVEL
jgi:hypothetical protein